MKKIYQYWTVFIIALEVLLFIPSFKAEAIAQAPVSVIASEENALPYADSEEEHIESFDSLISVNADSSIDVTETIAYDFGDEEKHGIYREIPLSQVPGGVGTTRITGVTVTDENGEPYTINNISYSSSGVYVKVGDADQTITGEHTYIVSYHATRGIGYFEDFDEIYWNVTGTEWGVPIFEATATVVLPSVVPEKNLQYHSYCGVSGEAKECGSIDIDESGKVTIVHFSSDAFAGPDSMFSAYEGMTVAVGFPKGLVTVPELSMWEKANTYYILAAVIFGFFLLLFILWYFISYLPKYNKLKRPIIAEYEPPAGMSPSVAGAIYNKIVSVGTLATADILHLAAEGYITIEGSDQPFEGKSFSRFGKGLPGILMAGAIFVCIGLAFSWWITLGLILLMLLKPKKLWRSIQNLLHPARFILSRTDKAGPQAENLSLLYNAVTEQGGPVDLSTLTSKSSYIVFDNYKSAVTDEVKKAEDKDTPPGQKRLKIPMALAVFILVLLSIFAIPILFSVISSSGIDVPSAILADVVAFFGSAVLFTSIVTVLKAKLARMTPAWYAVAGLREYIKVAEQERIKFESNPADSMRIFSKLLPYATVFGLEDKWAGIFAGIVTTPPEWYHGANTSAFSAAAFVTSVHSLGGTVSSVSNAGRPVSSGSSGSSGGGSSGGGGGGGGGGSW